MLFWYVPAPDQALLISGSKRGSGESQFRIVTGHGAFVLPVLRKARYLSLELRQAEIEEQCVSKQGIPLKLRAVAIFKIGDDPGSIANAARRFLAEQNDMDQLCGRIFAGHLRSIVGSLTVEEIVRERDRVAQEVKEGSNVEMEKLGSARPGGRRRRAAGRAPEERVRARDGDRQGEDRRRGPPGRGRGRAGRAARGGQGHAGRHRRADRPRPARRPAHRAAPGVRGAPAGGRRGL